MKRPSKRSTVTIRDVARHASVSPMSVSNFINGRVHLMRNETRQRIEKAIAQLQYRPNSQARGFRQGKDYSVGMIVVDPSPNFLVEPFIGHVVTGLISELASEGYACLLEGLTDCTEDERALKNFARADALCIFPSGPPEIRRRFCARLATLGIPLVVIEENEKLADSDSAIVRQDDAFGAAALVTHLMDLGARDFLYVSPKPVWPANTERENAFRSTLKKSRKKATLQKLTCGFGNFDEVQLAINGWLDAGGRCDAILANNDHIGIAVLRALAMRSIRVPEDMLVTGFGAFELWNYSNPRLTTIVSPAHRLGQTAARALLNRLVTGRFAQREWVLPVTLRAGETTRSAAAAKRA